VPTELPIPTIDQFQSIIPIENERSMAQPHTENGHILTATESADYYTMGTTEVEMSFPPDNCRIADNPPVAEKKYLRQ